MNKTSAKYLHAVSSSQLFLTVAEKTQINNSDRATPVSSYSDINPAEYKLFLFKKSYPAAYAKHKWFSDCAKSDAPLGLLINK
jgi:hypothetical protein